MPSFQWTTSDAAVSNFPPQYVSGISQCRYILTLKGICSTFLMPQLIKTNRLSYCKVHSFVSTSNFGNALPITEVERCFFFNKEL